jgi:hypothetical protein
MSIQLSNHQIPATVLSQLQAPLRFLLLLLPLSQVFGDAFHGFFQSQQTFLRSSQLHAGARPFSFEQFQFVLSRRLLLIQLADLQLQLFQKSFSARMPDSHFINATLESLQCFRSSG